LCLYFVNQSNQTINKQSFNQIIIMNKKLLLLIFAVSAFCLSSQAQDTIKTTGDAPLVLSGSVDTYFKTDFSGHGNIPTSFANENSSISIGMIDLGLKKSVGKASFVGELSFGPRGQEQSLPDGSNKADPIYTPGVSSYHIQNLYVSYNVTDKFNLTGGYMSTFIGYEVISPAANFNYSTSYLFTNGPFQNAGFKATYTFSDKVSLMAGIFNDYWNTYQSLGGRVNTFGAQLTVTPVKNWTAYLNVAAGPQSGTEFDLTTAYQITTAFKLGLNYADFSAPTGLSGGFSGVALYPQLAVSKVVTLGLRGEYFTTKTGTWTTTAGPAPGDSVTGLTATANIKTGPLTLIPEIRLDNSSKNTMFTDGGGLPTSSATQFVLAAVYAF
jgi:hypothetical protein